MLKAQHLPADYSNEFYWALKLWMMLMLHNWFQSLKAEGRLENSPSEARKIHQRQRHAVLRLQVRRVNSVICFLFPTYQKPRNISQKRNAWVRCTLPSHLVQLKWPSPGSGKVTCHKEWVAEVMEEEVTMSTSNHTQTHRWEQPHMH